MRCSRSRPRVLFALALVWKNSCCLLAFDLLALDGKDMPKEPLKRRRAALEAALVHQPRRVELSACRLMRTAREVRTQTRAPITP